MKTAAVSLAYLACIPLANWTLDRFGFVPVGFGWTVPAGVWFAAVALTLRDGVQELAGRLAVVVIIVAGAALSLLVSPVFAVASGAAFLTSELLDFAVYTPLRDRGRVVTAVLVSNSVGAVIDSALFLWLAFGAFAGLAPLVVVKVLVGALGAAVFIPLRSRILAIG